MDKRVFLLMGIALGFVIFQKNDVIKKEVEVKPKITKQYLKNNSLAKSTGNNLKRRAQNKEKIIKKRVGASLEKNINTRQEKKIKDRIAQESSFFHLKSKIVHENYGGDLERFYLEELDLSPERAEKLASFEKKYYQERHNRLEKIMRERENSAQKVVIFSDDESEEVKQDEVAFREKIKENLTREEYQRLNSLVQDQ